MKKLFYSIVSLLFFVLTISCSGTKEEEAQTQETPAEPGDSAVSSKDFFYSLPSPVVMVNIFRKAGLKYMDGIANSPDKVSKYNTAFSKTLNLGVYSADLAYTVLNKQQEQAMKYMEAVKRLSDELGMSSLFDTEDYLRRFRNNLDNEDSLIAVVSELKSEMDVFMNDTEKERQTLLIFIGAWLENMYIATQLTKEANKEKVALRLAEQKYVLSSLMTVSANFQNDPEFSDLYKKMNELKSLFDNLTVQGEDEQLVMDERQLKAITEKTRELRKEITG